MAESQGSSKRILAAKFFDKVAEIDQIANTALSKSTAVQSELSRVQMDLRSLIESLQINFDSGMQNVQTQINEVTNVVIEEQEIRKSETEALQEQIFAQEDQFQKDVIGKRSKTISPDSFSGRMNRSLKKFAKENSGMLGLLGASAGLTAVASGGNWFTNLLPENPFKNNDNKGDGNGENNNNTQFSEENPPEGLRRVLTGLVDFVMFGATDMDYRGDLFGGNEENTDGDGEEITEGTNTYGNGEEGEEKTFFPSFSDLKETFDILTLKPIFDQVFPNNKGLLNMFNNKKENNKQIIETNESISGDLTTFTVDGKTYPRGHSLGYNPLPAEGGSTYGDPNYDPYSEFKLTNTTNEVEDGGTTVIEGGTQVINAGTTVNGNNKRGEVVAQTSFVKSASSPLVAINMSENNSMRELVVG